VLVEDYCDITGWPPGEQALYLPLLLDCYDRGGTFYAAFVDSQMVGAVVLESKFIGRNQDQDE